MIINAKGMDYAELNETVRKSNENKIILDNINGQRYIGAGTNEKEITVNGVPGNAIGAYLNGSTIICNSNVQDAAGDTMNDGEIIVYGSAGDACGYAMRGGKIFVRGNVGYRAGIHMKAYENQQPAIIIGGAAGAFLGEYQAGGNIIVLGLDTDEFPVGSFCAAGMYGGKIFIRTNNAPDCISDKVTISKAAAEEIKQIMPEIDKFSKYFRIETAEILSKDFYVLIPDTKNPYKQLYTNN